AQTFYNLPDCLNNWKIPEWSESKSNYSSPILAVDENFSYKGISNFKLNLSFSGDEWNAGIVEANGIFDLTLHKTMEFEVYLPENAPKKGLMVRVAIVSGDDYKWFEMGVPVEIKAGKRTTVRANFKNGNYEWKSAKSMRRMSDRIKSDIKKIAIRVESNYARYKGPVYVDNIRFVK
ncbi:MAG: hypothetical protein P9L90_06295, partial [Candidatus Aadella gelida]|nr:hypothetical protein [Candidatus Aadella gelida]